VVRLERLSVDGHVLENPHDIAKHRSATINDDLQMCSRVAASVAPSPKHAHGLVFKFRMGMEWQERLGCSYVWPPIGGFFTHPSTTVRKSEERVLQSHFDSEWAQEGTRKLIAAHHHRCILGFTESGTGQWLETVPVILPEDLPSCRWITCAPPGTPAWQCGWRSYHEFWRRSEELTEDLGNCVKCVVLWV
jgi:hypothetical protein